MSIEQQNESLKQRLMAVEHDKFLLAQKAAKLSAQLDSIRRGTATVHELSPPPESDLHQDQYIKHELDDYTTAYLTPQNSFGAPSSSFPSPSTANYSESSTPATLSLGLDALTTSKDMTQHPAAMLCDLQCQSLERSQASTRPTTPPPPQAATPSSTMMNPLYPVLISAVYSQLMCPLTMIFNSSKTGSPLPPSMMSMPMALPLIRWLISTPVSPITRKAAT